MNVIDISVVVDRAILDVKESKVISVLRVRMELMVCLVR